MADEVNNLEWIKCQIEIKRLETEKYIEWFKIVHAYSKSLITNLILINAGGFAAIPVIAAFVKVDGVSASQRIDMFKYPAGFLLLVLFLHFVAVRVHTLMQIFSWSTRIGTSA